MNWLPRKTIRYAPGKDQANTVCWEWLWFKFEYESYETHFICDPRKPATNKSGWWWAHNQ